ncbi:TetR/AcrR family transcriptional regulator [Luteimicrobium sp. DT211]|uniref:TetR/AcrR family transcriptional regulator n=1 Tax=Luteimicrobium sp. DT211 TaxID=3393412 RepID=UPI003CF51F40
MSPPEAPAGVAHAGRRPRADAARNRAALLDAARATLAAGERLTLDAVARAAGLGIGTLYRHFPTREDLVAAVYVAELDAALDAAAPLREELPPADALRAWLHRYAAFIATKYDLAESMRAGALAGAAQAARTRERVVAVVGAFLRDGEAAGSLRPGLDAGDVTAAVVGVFLVTRDVPDGAQVHRLLDLLVDGLLA